MAAKEILLELGYTEKMLTGMTGQEIENEVIEAPYNV